MPNILTIAYQTLKDGNSAATPKLVLVFISALENIDTEAIPDLKTIMFLKGWVDKCLVLKKDSEFSAYVEIIKAIKEINKETLDPLHEQLLQTVSDKMTELAKKVEHIGFADMRDYLTLVSEIKKTGNAIYIGGGTELAAITVQELSSLPLSVVQQKILDYAIAYEKLNTFNTSLQAIAVVVVDKKNTFKEVIDILSAILMVLDKIDMTSLDENAIALLSTVAQQSAELADNRTSPKAESISDYDTLAIEVGKISCMNDAGLPAAMADFSLLLTQARKESEAQKQKIAASVGKEKSKENAVAKEIVDSLDLDPSVTLKKLKYTPLPVEALDKIYLTKANNSRWSHHRKDNKKHITSEIFSDGWVEHDGRGNDTYIIDTTGPTYYSSVDKDPKPRENQYKAKQVVGLAAGINRIAQDIHPDPHVHMTMHFSAKYTRIFDNRSNHLLVIERDIKIADKRDPIVDKSPSKLAYDVVHVYHRISATEWELKGYYVLHKYLDNVTNLINDLEKTFKNIPTKTSPELTKTKTLGDDRVKWREAKKKYDDEFTKVASDNSFAELKAILNEITKILKNLTANDFVLLTQVITLAIECVKNKKDIPAEFIFYTEEVEKCKKVVPFMEKITGIEQQFQLSCLRLRALIYPKIATIENEMILLAPLLTELNAMRFSHLQDDEYELLMQVIEKSIGLVTSKDKMTLLPAYQALTLQIKEKSSFSNNKLAYIMFGICTLVSLSCLAAIICLSAGSAVPIMGGALSYYIIAGSLSTYTAGAAGSHARRYLPLYDAMQKVEKPAAPALSHWFFAPSFK